MSETCPKSRMVDGTSHDWQYLGPLMKEQQCRFCDAVRPVTWQVTTLASGSIRADRGGPAEQENKYADAGYWHDAYLEAQGVIARLRAERARDREVVEAVAARWEAMGRCYVGAAEGVALAELLDALADEAHRSASPAGEEAGG